jgi:hypothetical protein
VHAWGTSFATRLTRFPSEHAPSGCPAEALGTAALWNATSCAATLTPLAQLALQVKHRLLPALLSLVAVLEGKAVEFESVVKVGRTHLQDAVPMTGALSHCSQNRPPLDASIRDRPHTRAFALSLTPHESELRGGVEVVLR